MSIFVVRSSRAPIRRLFEPRRSLFLGRSALLRMTARVGVFVLAVAVIGTVCTAPAGAGTVSHVVPGTGVLLGIDCAGGGMCEAVGEDSSAVQGVAVSVTDGGSGSVQAVPGTGRLVAVACTGATNCTAVGQTSPGSQGAVVAITNGLPGGVQAVRGSEVLAGIACPVPNTCEAVGVRPTVTGAPQGVIVPITDGIPGSPVAVPGTQQLVGVACPDASTCEAVGMSPAGQGVVVAVTSRAPGTVQAVSGTSGLNGVTCTSTSTCVAVGQAWTKGAVVPITGGTPGSARTVSGINSLQSIACTSTTCEAVGGYSGHPGGVTVPVFNGIPRNVAAVPGTNYLDGVSCPGPNTCQAAGGWNPPGTTENQGVAATVTIQTTVSLTFDNAAISQYTLGYLHALQPNAVHATFYVSSGVTGGSAHMSWAQLATLRSGGNEIAGKTVDGTNLTTLTAQQQTSEICNDRHTLSQHGLNPSSFAYPGGAFNSSIETEVHDCGYDNARTAGSLSPSGPTYSESSPPSDALALRAYAPNGKITLANLESLVTDATAAGGGLVPVVFQKVCSQTLDPANYTTCTTASGWIELADLNTFLDWVHNAGADGGAPAGTSFNTIAATLSA